MPLDLIADVVLEQALVFDPLVVSPSISIHEAIACMSAARASCPMQNLSNIEDDFLRTNARATCLLVMEGDELVGILTERDIVHLSAEEHPTTPPISAVMTRNIITLKQSEFTDIFVALHLLQKHHIRHLPVVNDQGQVVGLLTHETLRQLLRPVDLLRLRVVSEIMTSQVVQSSPDDSILEIAKLMTQHCVSSVVIVEQSPIKTTHPNNATPTFAKTIGIVTEGDIVQFQALGLNFKQIQAQRVMSSPVFAVHSDTSLWAAQQLMQQKHLSRLVVEGDRGELLGIVTQSSILQALNPVEIFKLVEALDQKICRLEAERVELLQNRNIELEGQVQQRTAELKKQTEREQLLSTIATRIHASLEIQDILNAVVVEVQQFLQCDRALIYQFNPNGSGIVTAEAVLPDWPSALQNIITDSCFEGKINRLYTQGVKHAISNIYDAGYPDCYIQLLEYYQVKANLVVPILVEQKLWGLLIGHQCSSDRHWEITDLELLDRIAVQVAIAIQQYQAYEKTQKEIVERRQAEEALRKSEATKQAIIQGIPDLLIRTNLQGERIEVLSCGSAYVLNPPEGVLQPTIFDIIPEAQAKQQLQHIQKALKTGGLQTYEQQIKTDNQVYWEEVRIAPLNKDEAIVIIRDITARKQAEAAFQSLVEGAAAIAGDNFFTELVQYIAEVLDVRYVMVATQEGETLRSEAFWLDGQTQPNMTYCIDKTPCNLALGAGEYICLDNVQEKFPWDQKLKTLNAAIYVGIALKDTQGEIIGCLYIVDSKPLTRPQLTIAMLRVFAARVSAELERQTAIDNLKQLNEELEDRITQRTLELSDFKYALDEAAIVSSTDAEGVITYVNDQFCEISKYTRKELLGVTHKIVNSSYHSQHFFVDFWATIRNGKIWRGEIQNRAKDGTNYWVDMTVVPFLNQQGKPVQYLAISSDITARKWAEFHASSLKERLQFLLASSPAVIYTCEASAQYGTTSISENVTTLLGYNPNKFLENPDFWVDHLHPCDRERVMLELPNLFQQGHHYHEYRFLHQDGTYRWMRDELRLICNAEGHPTEIIGYFADITDLKHTELELQELNLSLQNAMEGISRLDKNGQYISLNRTYAKLCGYEPEELVGSTWHLTVHPDDIPAMTVAYQTMLEQGRVETEAKGIRKDGSLFYKQVTMVTALNPEGQFNGHYCFLKDISDRKITEEALKHQLAAIEAAIDGIAVVEGDTYTYLNQAHLKMFGYQDTDELVGKSWTNLYSPEETNRIQQEVFPVLIQQQCWQGEAIATRKDGSTFHEGLSLTLTESGSLICVCRDITAQKEAEIKIRQANEQLLLANAELARTTRLKDEFLANMSHELRTPLNAILGMAEGLQEKVFGNINDNQQRAISTIDRSGKHLLELINDILDLSKIESGKLELQLEPTSVQYLCESSLTFVRQLAIRKNIQITTDIPTNIPQISVDERRIRQVLINLLNNAVKFTPEDGAVQLSVSQEQNESNGAILFQVSDTGIGIASEDLCKLFQPFVQIDSSLTRQYAGTGLGLTLVQQLTQLHGGEVTVSSEVGQGSCFTVKLPLTTIVESHATPPSALEMTTTYSSNRTILIVEDNPSATEQITRYLSEVGLQSVVQSTGEGVLEVALNVQPALILLDILLPDLSGWDVLTQLKSHPQLKTIPVVIASVMDERSRSLSLGAFECLVKPINRQQLHNVLHSLQISIPQSSIISTPSVVSKAETSLILLAEDNAANVATLSGYLKNRGFYVVLAEDGEEAIALTESYHPDLILMDIQMPRMDGFNAIRQIRTNSTIAHIPIIALTALAMPNDREKCLKAGANEYITKPVRLKSLVETMKRFL